VTPRQKPVRVLAIETSCDETACAVVQDGRALLSSVVASQMEMHARYGGVYPEVASRQHVLSIMPVIEGALVESHLTLRDIDAIAVTRGPGLAGALLVGINAAKGLSLGTGLPLVAVNHLEAHIYSAWVHPAAEGGVPEPEFPLLALIVSGGHTELILMPDHLAYQRLGGTLDDAAGEAFDKVARLLGLGYPGGPAVENAAQDGDARRFRFPRAWLESSWDFSFSGLKTAVLYAVRELEAQGKTIPVADMAASFQSAAVEVLVHKAAAAAREHAVRSIVLAGGVAANRALREALRGQAACPVHIPALSLCTDNAAMIAAAGYFRFKRADIAGLDVDVAATWPLTMSAAKQG